jgi:hypothetical protein
MVTDDIQCFFSMYVYVCVYIYVYICNEDMMGY